MMILSPEITFYDKFAISKKITSVETAIKLTEDTINLFASKTELTQLTNSKETLFSWMSKINLSLQDITLSVSDSKYETIDGVLKAISEAESSIKINSDNISLKVDKDGIVSSINQSPESVSINANKINLHGIVTANENFKILEDGSMVAKNGTFSGTLASADGIFSGELKAAKGTFSGELKAATGTFSGSLSAASGTFSGKLEGASGTFKGALEAATGTFSGNLSAASGTFKGNLMAAGGTFSGELQAVSGTFSRGIHCDYDISFYNAEAENPDVSSSRISLYEVYAQAPLGIKITNSTYNGEAAIEFFGWEKKIRMDGNVEVRYNLTCYGTKNRVIETKDYNNRLQYCYEMSSPMFGDIGEAETDEFGDCFIYLDDIFYETVNSKIEYQVFLQKEGTGELWVDSKESTFFVVKGTPNLTFSWEIKVKQLDYEYERLEEYQHEDNGMSVDYEKEYITEISKLIKEQEDLLYETIE